MPRREEAPLLLVQTLFLGPWQAYQGFWELSPSVRYIPPQATVGVVNDRRDIRVQMLTAPVENRDGYIPNSLQIPAQSHVFDTGITGELADGFSVECRSSPDCCSNSGVETLGGFDFAFLHINNYSRTAIKESWRVAKIRLTIDQKEYYCSHMACIRFILGSFLISRPNQKGNNNVYHTIWC